MKSHGYGLTKFLGEEGGSGKFEGQAILNIILIKPQWDLKSLNTQKNTHHPG